VKFIDEAAITVQSGDGGRGCVSFRRERSVPRGGPDGGDGGNGGDVVMETTTRKRTLYQFQFKRQFKAENGRNGQGKQKTGRGGLDLLIELPPGTMVANAETGELIKDLIHEKEKFVVAKGGRGGQGNRRFATSTNRAPRMAQPGEPGETLSLRLELKLLADVGIIGLPNAGKSTLTRAMSSANPVVGSYPFTTLSPNLGVVRAGYGEPFVVADIPGLIRGAHKGAGLGIRFLRHIERTRVLLHLIDVASPEPDDPLSAYEAVNSELGLYSEKLIKKPQLVVLNKMDIPGAEKAAEEFRAAVGDKVDSILISAATGKGVGDMTSSLVQFLDKVHEKK